MTPALILASGSPRRRELLAALGLSFTVLKPDIDEAQRPGEAPLAYVQRLSREKAEAVAVRLSVPGAVLAADTIVILAADTLGVTDEGDILGKPADAAEARAMLLRLRGRAHLVCTSLYLRPAAGPGLTRTAQTTVTMRDYSDVEIDAYIATGDPFDKAGSYAIQHPAFRPVAHIAGCYSNVVGLPVCLLQNALVELGWPGLTPVTPAPDCACTAV